VTAVQGIVLTAVTAGMLPGVVAAPVPPLVATGHSESHGRELWWLWRSHRAGSGAAWGSWAVGWVHA
jgi:hypothetical protein